VILPSKVALARILGFCGHHRASKAQVEAMGNSQERVGRLHLSLEETGCLLKRLHFCGRKLELIRYAVVFVSVWFVLLCFWNRGGILGLNLDSFYYPIGNCLLVSRVYWIKTNWM
jgi:hypothetical protein